MLRSAPNHQNTRIRTLDKEKTIIKTPKFTEKIMVAGGITAQGVTELYMLEISKTITGKVYEGEILPIYINALNNKGLMPNPKYTTFLQDSAPAHTKSSVIKKNGVAKSAFHTGRFRLHSISAGLISRLFLLVVLLVGPMVG